MKTSFMGLRLARLRRGTRIHTNYADLHELRKGRDSGLIPY